MGSIEIWLIIGKIKKKKISQEGKLIGIENHRNTSKQSIQEDNHKKTGRRPYRRKALEEEGLTGRWKHRNLTSLEADITKK